MKIYVASSWRNAYQGVVVKELRKAGHEVYDFKNPAPGNVGFSWSLIDPNWKSWTDEEYIKALAHPIAVAGFFCDANAMNWADACVLVMPCGRSAHVEAGWMQGIGKITAVLLAEGDEPELMYKLFGDQIFTDLNQVVAFLKTVEYTVDE